MARTFQAPMSLALALALALPQARSLAQDTEMPRLVVGIVVDQMRWDYLYRYSDLYGEGGFRRLMREGYNCENTMIDYVPSVTSIGHASVFTGSVPAIHGIAGNSFFENGKSVYCCGDDRVRGVGSDTDAGRMSPRNMLATTIGDELKIATGFKSRVVGVALKDRAAILPAGHSADGAFWFDFSAGKFITSTYYMDRLPAWVAGYNETIGEVTKDEVSYSPLGNRLTIEMAKAAIEGERLGQGQATDMLTISFSCPDLIGHRWATHHERTREIYVDLDSRLGDFLAYLDDKVGEGEYLVFLTADHGAANNILMLREHGIPAGGFFAGKARDELGAHLGEAFAVGEDLVLGISNYRVYLDHAKIAALGLDPVEVKREAIKHLAEDPGYAFVVDLENAALATVPSPIKEKIMNGYNRRRGGDIQLVLDPANYEVYDEDIGEGTTHGLWNPYDAHVPFILMGWHVKAGTTRKECHITDIAPTVCSLMHVQMPNGCVGRPVLE